MPSCAITTWPHSGGRRFRAKAKQRGRGYCAAPWMRRSWSTSGNTARRWATIALGRLRWTASGLSWSKRAGSNTGRGPDAEEHQGLSLQIYVSSLPAAVSVLALSASASVCASASGRAGRVASKSKLPIRGKVSSLFSKSISPKSKSS